MKPFNIFPHLRLKVCLKLVHVRPTSYSLLDHPNNTGNFEAPPAQYFYLPFIAPLRRPPTFSYALFSNNLHLQDSSFYLKLCSLPYKINFHACINEEAKLRFYTHVDKIRKT